MSKLIIAHEGHNGAAKFTEYPVPGEDVKFIAQEGREGWDVKAIDTRDGGIIHPLNSYHPDQERKAVSLAYQAATFYWQAVDLGDRAGTAAKHHDYPTERAYRDTWRKLKRIAPDMADLLDRAWARAYRKAAASGLPVAY